jgi:Reverse transcriptase (RNA-dependent DNA polymerase)
MAANSKIALAVAKLFELLICRTMYEDLRCLISESQHGYMQGCSTVTNLIEYASFILKAVEEGFQVDSIYTDFSKAFEKVRHCLLLLKFAASPIEPARCDLLRSYLSGRIQCIRIGNCVSSEIWVTSGVPQGRAAIWARCASYGSLMTSQEFSVTYEFFFMPMT